MVDDAVLRVAASGWQLLGDASSWPSADVDPATITVELRPGGYSYLLTDHPNGDGFLEVVNGVARRVNLP